MSKKAYAFALAAVVIIFITATVAGTSSVAFAANEKANGLNEYASRAAYLVDYDSGKVLFERNSDAKYPIASMVKIMTLAIAYDEIKAGKLSFDQMITVSDAAAGMGGSQMFLEAGKEYSVADLIKGVTVVSANDASVAIAETIAGSKEAFVDTMNAKAAELGMENTKFVNVTGLPEAGQYSTARDVTKMMRKLLENPDYYRFSKIYMENYTHPDGRISELVNTNKLIRFFDGCDGGKTGFTNDAMFCLSATAKRGETRVIATVLGAETSKLRNAEISDLFNYAFRNYRSVKLLEKGKPFPAELHVKGGKTEQVELAAEDTISMLERIGEKGSFELRFTLKENLSAPVKAGEEIGVVELLDNSGTIVDSAAIVTLRDIDRRTILDGIGQIFENWFFGI